MEKEEMPGLGWLTDNGLGLRTMPEIELILVKRIPKTQLKVLVTSSSPPPDFIGF